MGNKLALVATLAVAAISLAGCNYFSGPKDAQGRVKAYTSGANFGNSGATACGTRQLVDGYFPGCAPPQDGDGYDTAPELPAWP